VITAHNGATIEETTEITPTGCAKKPTQPTRAEELATALRKCRSDRSRSKRLACERSARKRYGAKASARKARRASAKGPHQRRPDGPR
jgi:hypothetical protein